MTPEEFWSAGLRTGDHIPLEHAGKPYSLGTIVNPQRLLAELDQR